MFIIEIGGGSYIGKGFTCGQELFLWNLRLINYCDMKH